MNKIFIELLQVALGTREGLSRVPTDAEWERLLVMAEDQAIVGVLLCGIERLVSPLGGDGNHRGQEPGFIEDGISVPVPMIPLEVKLQWIGEVQMIEEQNRVMSKACREVVEQFEKDGFWCCVLKGQANLRYYPEEMRLRRSCGDIDIWARPNVVKSEKGKVKSGAYGLPLTAYKNPVRRTLEYVEGKYGLTGLCWLHCNFDYRGEVPVEVHFRPSFMNEPIHNHRLQRWFGLQLKSLRLNNENENDNGIRGLPVEVDVVYQMNHIYRHLIDEGVGLRQVIDYYYCLKAYGSTKTITKTKTLININDRELSVNKDEVMKTIEWLGMKRFAGALMYVMKEVCGMGDEELLCEPDEKAGRFLLSEIMTAGNFGQADPRMGELNTTSNLKRQLSQAWRRFKRNMRFVRSYPGEVIWEPVARMEHFAWKQLGLWNY